MPHVIEFEQRTNRGGEPRDWVHVSSSPVDAQYASTWQRVREFEPTEDDMHADDDGAVLKRAIWETDIKPLYDLWKSGEAFVVDGTPLSTWIELPAGIAKTLNGLGVRTIEQVAELTASDMERMNIPDTSGLKRSAQNYLDAKADQLAADAANSQAAIIAELQAKIEALEAAKPKRGRPPKAQPTVEEGEE